MTKIYRVQTSDILWRNLLIDNLPLGVERVLEVLVPLLADGAEDVIKDPFKLHLKVLQLFGQFFCPMKVNMVASVFATCAFRSVNCYPVVFI